MSLGRPQRALAAPSGTNRTRSRGLIRHHSRDPDKYLSVSTWAWAGARPEVLMQMFSNAFLSQTPWRMLIHTGMHRSRGRKSHWVEKNEQHEDLKRCHSVSPCQQLSSAREPAVRRASCEFFDQAESLPSTGGRSHHARFCFLLERLVCFSTNEILLCPCVPLKF